MLNRIRRRFTFTGLIAVAALVFAMAGGAFAANKYIITSTNQIRPAVVSQLKGVTKVNSGEGLEGGPIEGEGTLAIDPSETQKRVSESCGEGEAISEVKQSGEVECESAGGGGGGPIVTGVWSVDSEEGVKSGVIPVQASISYTQEISPAPKVAYITPGGSGGFVINAELGSKKAADGGKNLGAASEVAEVCGVSGAGAVAAPSAEPGYACVFVGEKENIEAVIEPLLFTNESSLWKSPAATSGAVIPFSLEAQPFLPFSASEGGYAKGSWAVNTE